MIDSIRVLHEYLVDDTQVHQANGELLWSSLLVLRDHPDAQQNVLYDTEQVLEELRGQVFNRPVLF